MLDSKIDLKKPAKGSSKLLIVMIKFGTKW
jgi:hypothetical protein